MGKPKYGIQTHFVKWDDETAGGRWYECTIGEKMSDGRYKVLGHEGSEGHFFAGDLVEIGTTPRPTTDEALAYYQGGWSSYDYASYCVVQAKKPGHFWVKYTDGGSEEWVPENKVHKAVRI